MKKIILALSVLLATAVPAVAQQERPSNKHEIYFEGTNYELHVYRIMGRLEGKTMLIIGGIQGDEQGGYLSTDLYSDLALEKGNLIVVPRANLHSVMKNNRGIEGDMNRYFDDKTPQGVEGDVVRKLKELIAESDILLNMHDGWGFHYPVYVDNSRNPNRFGQSIIIDEDIFVCKDNAELKLGDMARTVLEVVNEKIPETNLKMHLFDTETNNDKSKFKSMRKSATWYALNEKCVPAFGVEGSKNNKSLERNILYHNYVVNEFMRIMGIIPEQPRVMILRPEMESASIMVNDVLIEVPAGGVLELQKNDSVRVTYIKSNYTRGVSCDVLGYGTMNDFNKTFEITGNTSIVFRKDNHVMSEIKLNAGRQTAGRSAPDATTKPSVWVFLFKVNGEFKTAVNGEIVKIKRGSELEFIKLFSDTDSDSGEMINVKGWYPDVNVNTGDDRGFIIPIPSRKMMEKYSVDGRGKIYPVIAGSSDRDKKAEMFIEIE